MTTQFFKTVFAGILAAVALFMLPFFLLRVFIFFAIIGLVFRLLGGRRHHGFRHRMNPAFAERYNAMSEEERTQYRNNYRGRCGYWNEEKSTETQNQ